MADTPKAIFLYTEAATISDEAVKALTDAGYIPVRVSSLDDVKLVSLETVRQVAPQDMDAITRAALRTVQVFGETSVTVQGSFGAQLAGLLLAKKEKP